MTPAGQASKKAQRMLGRFLYFFGILITLALGSVTIWGDLEASLFDVSIQAQRNLDSLRCPVLITRHETGQITASFENTSQRPVNRAIRANISDGFVTLIREENLQLPLQPGERQSWVWEVTADDAAYNYLILARINTLRQSPMPSKSGACGILVVPIPWVSGQKIVIGWLALGLAAIVGGGWLWRRATPTPIQWHPVLVGSAAMSLAVIAVLILGLMGLWIPGVILLAIFVLLLITVASQLLMES
jgi:hypothetical protein